MPLKSLNYFIIAMMLGFALLVLIFSGFLEFPSVSSSIPSVIDSKLEVKGSPDPFRSLLGAFKKWDSEVGCAQFKEKHKAKGFPTNGSSSSLQDVDGSVDCGAMKMDHVSILVKGWTWIPDNLDNLYSCRCGLSCLWTKSSVLADKPDAMLFETTRPPSQLPLHPHTNLYSVIVMNEKIHVLNIFCFTLVILIFLFYTTGFLALHFLTGISSYVCKRRKGDPLRVYMDLEAGRKRSGFEDIFIGYHAKDDVQSTYAGALFHNNRNYHLSAFKNNDTLVYWSSSRCLSHRNQLAESLLTMLPHHSFGKCLNNVGGLDMALVLYPECANDANSAPKWWDHLHCAMSHYKFVLAIENTATESYVTEKLFYALDAGAVPIYFGAPNVWDFLPPNSIIDGTKFSSMEELASYVKTLANDPVAYAEYHAWRRCGVLANYGKARAASLDTLPCRLCEAVSRKSGRNARTM
ncbi:hypothetical protein HHK36_004432 [Tetracentron sinense]|uniref:Fucosyltransferase n=1 Tax=Tetracentron sinense TaxID=13715 RepID=A0A835DQB3_TETSI|nr:hypothetical protein HHK36_004432 [Tetracentron sinense]